MFWNYHRLGIGFVAVIITECNIIFPSYFPPSSGEAGLLPSSAESSSDFDFLDVLNSIRKNETM